MLPRRTTLLPTARKTGAALLVGALVAVTAVTAAAATLPIAAAASGQRYIDQVFSAVDVTNDVVYATAPSLNGPTTETLTMDVYSPAGDTVTSRPAIVFIHGGGFKGGDKSNDIPDATAYAQRGYVTVSINYRLDRDNVCQALQDNELTDPAEIAAAEAACQTAIVAAQHDAEGAIRWIRAHAASLGVDQTRIATIGFSAGAVTAANLAYRSQDPGDVGDFDGEDSRVQAAIAASGCEYDPATIGAGDAPMFFLHAEFDQAVPFACAVDNAAAARAAGLPVETMLYFGESTHARALYNKYRSAVDARWTAFLYTYLSLDHPVPAGSQTVIHGLPGRSAVVSLVSTGNVEPGYVQVLPCGSAPGGSSNLNADRIFQTRSALAVVSFDANGEACLYNQSTTHLVADLQGYFVGGAIDDVADVRLVDTRSADGTARLGAATLTRIDGRPNSTAVVSIVAVDTAGPGFVQAVDCATAPGATSNVNADRSGETIANLAFVHFDSGGHACVFNQTAANIVVDLQAYLSDAAFDDIVDVRALDTRLDPGVAPADGAQTPLSGRADATAVTSIVAVDAGGPGYVQALGCGTAPGSSSNLNVDTAGQTIANLAVVHFASDGRLCLFDQTSTHLVLDVQGYLMPGAFDDIADVRLLDTRT